MSDKDNLPRSSVMIEGHRKQLVRFRLVGFERCFTKLRDSAPAGRRQGLCGKWWQYESTSRLAAFKRFILVSQGLDSERYNWFQNCSYCRQTVENPRSDERSYKSNKTLIRNTNENENNHDSSNDTSRHA
jgi:hypothetical protein